MGRDPRSLRDRAPRPAARRPGAAPVGRPRVHTPRRRPPLLPAGAARPGWDFLGTTIEAILRQPPCDLAVVKGRPARAKRVLVPVRGGRYAQLAARLAIELARSGTG